MLQSNPCNMVHVNNSMHQLLPMLLYKWHFQSVGCQFLKMLRKYQEKLPENF